MESDAKYSNLCFKNGGSFEYNVASSSSDSGFLRLRPTTLSLSRMCSPDDDAEKMYAINGFSAVSSQLPPRCASPNVNHQGPSIMEGEKYGGASSTSVDPRHQQFKGRSENYILVKQNTSPAGWFTNHSSHSGLGDKNDLVTDDFNNWANGEKLGGFRCAPWSRFAGTSTPGGIKRESNADQGLYPSITSKKVAESEKKPRVLSRRLSLPSVAEKMILQMDGSVPCRTRAKRGCATHPRSIAERVRRTRISERMRKLQELVPNMDKQTNTADMLELAVEYVKGLQRQCKMLSDERANCRCSAAEMMLVSDHARRSS